MTLQRRPKPKPLAAMLEGAADRLGEVTTILEACRAVAQQERLFLEETAIESLHRDAQPLAKRAREIAGRVKRSEKP